MTKPLTPKEVNALIPATDLEELITRGFQDAWADAVVKHADDILSDSGSDDRPFIPPEE